MSASSDEEYELLPTYSDDPDRAISRIEKRRTKRGRLYSIRRLVRKHPILIFFVSLSFVILSSAVLAYDILYLQTKLAIAGSYNAFVNKLWPVGLPNRTDIWENENSKAMHALMTCMSANNCKQNQESIVLLSSSHFAGSIAGAVSGEDIWATSVLDAVRELGYTAIFTTTEEELEQTYRQYPDLVKIAIVEGATAERCFSNPRCVKTVNHPMGVPAWKMFSFHFWRGSANPLGNAWTLSPEDYDNMSDKAEGNFYLGYSIERMCLRIPVTPIQERPSQAYILAKQTQYFFDKEYAWPGLDYDPNPIDVELVAGIRDHHTKNGETLPQGITDLGLLNKTQFYHHLGRSRALVGIGRPVLSPSPYDALCMGVPFINPIMGWDKANPKNRSRWGAQHDGLKYQDPPYVYNVMKGDTEGFWDAIRTAIETPIERYVIPEMTMEALKYRVSKLVEGNWKEKAVRLLEERKISGKGQLFEI